MSPPLPSALERWAEIATRLRGAPFAVFLDFDGTLSPIVSRPQDAELPAVRREQLRRLAAVARVAIVTGRAMADIRARAGLPTLHYASDHGFQIAGPDVAFEVDPGLREGIAEAASALGERLRDTAGVVLEPKRYSVAVHYRLADPRDVPRIEAVVDDVVASREGLRKGIGRAVFEVRPARPWHKGAAVEWLCERFGVSIAVYVGDDRTDEDALKAVRERGGIGIVVGTPDWATAASYRVADPVEVGRVLEALASIS
jgi:trehalose-phosphatase